MKKIILVLVASLVTAGVSDAAQQAINQITTPTTSREALRNAVNTENAKVQSNFVELYAAAPNDLAYGSAWNANLRAPSMNAIYDKIEAMILGSGNMVFPSVAGITTFNGTTWGDSLTLDTDLTSVSASDESVPSAKAVKAALDTKDSIQPTTLDITSDTTVSLSQLLANKFVTNQGASGEVDITLPAVSYSISRTIIVEEAQIVRLTPPSGEAFDLSGTALSVDQSFAGPATVGSKVILTRMQNASGAWIWSADVARGVWAGI